MQWLIAPGIALFLILAYTLIKRYAAKRLRSYLDSVWGNERALRNADDEQINDITQFDMALRSHAPPLRETDSTTWNDLDMDLVFRSIDCSRSIVGSEVLYAMLHEQGRNQEELDRIDQLSDGPPEQTRPAKRCTGSSQRYRLSGFSRRVPILV